MGSNLAAGKKKTSKPSTTDLMWRLLHEIDVDGSLLSLLPPRLPELLQDLHLSEQLFVAEVFTVEDDRVGAAQLVSVGRGVAVLERAVGLNEPPIADTPACCG